MEIRERSAEAVREFGRGMGAEQAWDFEARKSIALPGPTRRARWARKPACRGSKSGKRPGHEPRNGRHWPCCRNQRVRVRGDGRDTCRRGADRRRQIQRAKSAKPSAAPGKGARLYTGSPEFELRCACRFFSPKGDCTRVFRRWRGACLKLGRGLVCHTSLATHNWQAERSRL
jgi:hypothetical protein